MLLRCAGLGLRMRVLDLDCGAGDLAFVAAELIGSRGEIVGGDQSVDSVSTARATERGLSNARFGSAISTAPCLTGCSTRSSGGSF
jgi:ubiquinone/menaquinone biosynthesis C-methylase UbiE